MVIKSLNIRMNRFHLFSDVFEYWSKNSRIPVEDLDQFNKLRSLLDAELQNSSVHSCLHLLSLMWFFP